MGVKRNFSLFQNPFKPGAGHTPPYLAGRVKETKEFEKLLEQDTILENVILTGLRGVGKTVLLDKFKPIAISSGWLWAGADLSESVSVSEEIMAKRIITDLSILTSEIKIGQNSQRSLGFKSEEKKIDYALDYHTLSQVYSNTPGLVADKLKRVLELSWEVISSLGKKGLIFSYDEAQTISNRPDKDLYPLSLLLDVFQSIQRKGIPFMLVLTGLPMLFSKMVDARTYSERMFKIIFLNKLSRSESKGAIIKPIEDAKCPVKFTDDSIEKIIDLSGGYPYFIQFICKEVYDSFIQKIDSGITTSIPVEEIISKLDRDFFAGRWHRVTDRQRELLSVIARLENCHAEFSVQEVVQASKIHLENGFGSSHVNQMLNALIKAGLIYKNRHGKYSFAVPLLEKFILRQMEDQLF